LYDQSYNFLGFLSAYFCTIFGCWLHYKLQLEVVYKHSICIYSVEVIKKVWKNQRDAYKKKKKKIVDEQRSGSGAGTKIKKGKFHDQLTFLDPYLADRE